MKKWIPLIVIAGTVAFTLSVYDQLPERVVTHWGVNGPNGWSSRPLAAWLGPAIAAGLWLILSVIPKIDPRRANYAGFQGSYDALVMMSVGIACAAHIAVLGYALGWPVKVEAVIPLLVGVMFVFIGWMLPRARSNFFIGIRTPWTLSSDEVWDKTHQIAGVTFALAGLAIASLALIRTAEAVWLVVAVVAFLVLVPVVYSYFYWRSIQSPR